MLFDEPHVVRGADLGERCRVSDLNMLVGPGGKERTLDEFGALFEAAGYRLAGATPTSSGIDVLEGAPV